MRSISLRRSSQCLTTDVNDQAPHALFAPEACRLRPGGRTSEASLTGRRPGPQPSEGHHIARRSSSRLAPGPTRPALETLAVENPPALGTVCTTFHRPRSERTITSYCAASSIRASKVVTALAARTAQPANCIRALGIQDPDRALGRSRFDKRAPSEALFRANSRGSGRGSEPTRVPGQATSKQMLPAS